jgi:hypothetical protein
MQRKRRSLRILLPSAAGLVAAAVLWWAFAVPALVKYPTDLDVTPRYDGMFTLFVDPATAAPLASPTSVPLDIQRHVRALGDESGASRVVVEETVRLTAGDIVDLTQNNVYVMDRRTLQNVADQRAYAFEPSNVVDRSGAYRLNLPFHTPPDATYDIYKNEIGTTYASRPDATEPTADRAGLRLHNFTASASEVPLDAAYLAELRKAVPLPESLTLDQLKPQLLRAGIDVDAVLAAVGPVITAEDLTTLAQIAAKPIPLQYVLSFDGRVGVETTTGAEVDVDATEAVGAKPVLADLATLQAIVAHYPDVPEAVAAGAALTALSSAAAVPLFEYHYQQTPASVADIAGEVSSLRDQMRLAERYVPVGLVVAAVVTLVVAALLGRRRAPTVDLRLPPPVAAPATEREPERVTGGSVR